MSTHEQERIKIQSARRAGLISMEEAQRALRDIEYRIRWQRRNRGLDVATIAPRS